MKRIYIPLLLICIFFQQAEGPNGSWRELHGSLSRRERRLGRLGRLRRNPQKQSVAAQVTPKLQKINKKMEELLNFSTTAAMLEFIEKQKAEEYNQRRAMFVEELKKN